MPDPKNLRSNENETETDSQEQVSPDEPKKILPAPKIISTNRGSIKRTLRKPPCMNLEKTVPKPTIAGRRLRVEYVEEEQDDEAERPGGRGRSGKGKGRH